MFRSGSKLQKKTGRKAVLLSFGLFFDRGVMGLEQNPGGGLSANGLHLAAHAFRNFEEQVARLVGTYLLFDTEVFFGGVLLGLFKGEARYFGLRLGGLRRIEFFFWEEVVEVDVANHGGFEEGDVLSLVVGVIAYEHVAGRLHEHGGDVDGSQERGEENASVDTVNLRGVQRVLKGANALGIDHIARQAGVGHRTVAEVALLQHVPQGVDLAVDGFGFAGLVAQELAHDAGVECLAQNFVDVRAFLVDVGGIEQAGTNETLFAVGQLFLVAQQTFVEAAHGEGAHFLPKVDIVHFYCGNYADGRGLIVVAQFFVSPKDVGVNDVFLVLFGQYEGRYGVVVERRFGQFDLNAAVGLIGFYLDGNARFGVADAVGGTHWLNDLCIGGGYGE